MSGLKEYKQNVNYQHQLNKAQSGRRPDTSELTKSQSEDVWHTYRTHQPNNSNSQLTHREQLYLLYICAFIFLGLIVWVGAQDIGNGLIGTLNNMTYPNARQLTENRRDEIDTSPAAEGYINIAEHIIFFTNPDKSMAGRLKEGIPQDSIHWLMHQSVNLNPKARENFGGKIVFLKNIPIAWQLMEKGQKPVKQAWFYAHQLHNFRAVDQEEYSNLRNSNFK